MKRILLTLGILAMLALTGCQDKTWEERNTCVGMTLADAKAIAEKECLSTEENTAFELNMSEVSCNEGTSTWWLDIVPDTEICNPACVINTKDKTAEINWRCTGLIDTDQPIDTANASISIQVLKPISVSLQIINGNKSESSIETIAENSTVLDLVALSNTVKTDVVLPLGTFIECIGEICNTNTSEWHYTVNGESSLKTPDNYVLEEGDDVILEFSN